MFNTLIKKCSLFLLFSTLTTLAPQRSKADIFGTDDRHNPKPGSLDEELAKSIAVGILTSLYEKKENGNFKVYPDYTSDFMCTDERFISEPSLPYSCTGFLVGPDLLITAGHCSTNYKEIFNTEDLYCDSYAWMFDYRLSKKENLNLNDVPKDKIYKCKEIIYAVSDEQKPYRDFALIRLNKIVKGRKYLKIAKTVIKKGDAVKMIGSPMGLPTKITDNATVLENLNEKNTFTTDLDAFQGNSGSPVFNKDNKVIGLLVSGSPSEGTYTDPKLQCERFNHCDENGLNCKSSESDKLKGSFKNGSDVEKLLKYKGILNQHID